MIAATRYRYCVHLWLHRPPRAQLVTISESGQAGLNAGDNTYIQDARDTQHTKDTAAKGTEDAHGRQDRAALLKELEQGLVAIDIVDYVQMQRFAFPDEPRDFKTVQRWINE